MGDDMGGGLARTRMMMIVAARLAANGQNTASVDSFPGWEGGDVDEFRGGVFC